MKDREAWRAALPEVAKSRTRLSDGTTTAENLLCDLRKLSALFSTSA